MSTFPHFSFRHTVPFAALLALSACAAPTAEDADDAEEEDGIETSSSAATSAIAEGTRDALGLLRFVNGAGKANLEAVRPRITRTVIERILGYRAGADAQLATADDRSFTTVGLLDAIPGVGPATLERLLAAARAAGFMKVDEFSPDWCEGPALTAADVAAMSTRYWDWMPVGFARTRVRFGSGEWQEASPDEAAVASRVGHLKAGDILGGAHARFHSATAATPELPRQPIFQLEQTNYRNEYCVPDRTSVTGSTMGIYSSCYRPLVDFHATLDFATAVTSAHISPNPISHRPGVRPIVTEDSPLYGSHTLRVTRSCFQLLGRWQHPYIGKEIEVSIGGTIPR